MVPKLKLPKFSNVSVCQQKIANGGELLDKLKLIFLRARELQVGNFSPERLRAKFRQSSEAKVLIFPSKISFHSLRVHCVPCFSSKEAFSSTAAIAVALIFPILLFDVNMTLFSNRTKYLFLSKSLQNSLRIFFLSCKKIDIFDQSLFLKIASQYDRE